MTCHAARQGLPLVGSAHVQELNAEIDWLAAQAAKLRALIAEYERCLESLKNERKTLTTTPAPAAGEKEQT